jgi:hypothetical protein
MTKRPQDETSPGRNVPRTKRPHDEASPRRSVQNRKIAIRQFRPILLKTNQKSSVMIFCASKLLLENKSYQDIVLLFLKIWIRVFTILNNMKQIQYMVLKYFWKITQCHCEIIILIPANILLCNPEYHQIKSFKRTFSRKSLRDCSTV